MPSVLPRDPIPSKLIFLFASKFASSPTPSAASAAAFSCAMRSASSAASSAPGVSGIVSKLEMLGLRDLMDVGVDGTEEDVYDPEKLYVVDKESGPLL